MKKPFDKDILLIILITIISIICIFTLPLTKYPINLVSYILLALFLPGYAFMAAIYPRKEDFGPYKRIFGSILVSLFITIILAFLTRYKVLSIGTSSIYLIIAITTIILSLAAIYRRYKFNKNSKENKKHHKRRNSNIRFSDSVKEDMKSSERQNDTITKKENLKIYRTRKHSIKDLYLVMFLTLISLAVLTLPVNKYLGNTILYPLKTVLIFLLILLSGYAFWAALIPITKLGSRNVYFLL